jgi:hypothetical protein
MQRRRSRKRKLHDPLRVDSVCASLYIAGGFG